MEKRPERSKTFIITPQVLPNLLKLAAERNKNPLRVRWLICENLGACDHSRNAFTAVGKLDDICPECGGNCYSMDDSEKIEGYPDQIVGKIIVPHFWEPIKKIYRRESSLEIANFDRAQHAVYTRYMPTKVMVKESRMMELLHTVNYRRTCDPELKLPLASTMEHVLDLSEPIEDFQVSLADLEEAWEANPLCPK